MQPLLDILQKTTAFFQQKGVPQARLDAELIIAHVLECKRLDLYLQFERLLTEEQLAAMRPLVARRGKREPLQYLLGEAHFCDLVLKVDARALIPRPETEELVELLTERFKDHPPASICDLGTGTGAIALALAHAFPQAQVTAVDVSAETLELARENAAATGLADRVRLVQSDWFSALAEERFDLVVSNPPYLTDDEWARAQPEVREWEPRRALTAGPDGLDDFERILTAAAEHLQPGGWLAFETGISQHKALEKRANELGRLDSQGLADISGRERFFLAKMPE